MGHAVFAAVGRATSVLAVFLFIVRMCPPWEPGYGWSSCFRRSQSRPEGFDFVPWEKWCEWKKPAREQALRRSMNLPDLSDSVVQSQPGGNAETAVQEALAAKC
jgi:hypothetical protein